MTLVIYNEEADSLEEFRLSEEKIAVDLIIYELLSALGWEVIGTL